MFSSRDVIRYRLRSDLYPRRCGHVDGVGSAAGRRWGEYERIEREALAAGHVLRERSRRCEHSSGRARHFNRDRPGIVRHGHGDCVPVIHVGRVFVHIVAGDLYFGLLDECEPGVYGCFRLCGGMLV